jgi:hypothetical protein
LHTMVDVNACQMAKADRDLQLWSHAQCWRLEVRTCLVMYHDNNAQSSVADSGGFLFLVTGDASLMIGCGLVYRLPAGTAKQLRAIICMHPLSCLNARRSHVEPSVVLIRLILRRHTRSSWRGSQLRRSPGIRELRRASVVGSAQHHIGRAFRNLPELRAQCDSPEAVRRVYASTRISYADADGSALRLR